MSVFGRMVGSTIHVVNKDSYSRRKKKNWLKIWAQMSHESLKEECRMWQGTIVPHTTGAFCFVHNMKRFL